MDIKVLGPGCANCQTLMERVGKALQKAGLTATITKVTDYDEMLAYGILRTPGLVIDGKLVTSGRVPTVDEIIKLMAGAGAATASGTGAGGCSCGGCC